MPRTGHPGAGFGLFRCTKHLCAPMHDSGGALSLGLGAAVPTVTEPRLPQPRTPLPLSPLPPTLRPPRGPRPRPARSRRTARTAPRLGALGRPQGPCGGTGVGLHHSERWDGGSVGSAGLDAVACLPSPHAGGFEVLGSLLGGSAQSLWSRPLFSFRRSARFEDGEVRCSLAAEHSAGMSPSQPMRCFAHGFACPGSQCVFTIPCVKYGVLRAAAVIAVIHISYRVLVGLCMGFWGCTAPCHRDGETPPQGGRELGDTVSVRL